MRKRLFIASSVEGLQVAYAVQENLDHEFDVTVWSQGVFNLSKSTLPELVRVAESSDAAAFVFSADDTAIIRGKEHPVIRDNVLFELGLFIGKLGPDSCFVLVPRSCANDLHLPTDLLGITPAVYGDTRDDDNLVAALGAAANKIRRALSPKGPPLSLPAEGAESPITQFLLSRPFRLFYAPGRSKRMVFGPKGLIREGNNRNEHSWRVRKQKLEFMQLNGDVHSRFVLDNDRFRHTNDDDTLSLRDQYMEPDDPIDR